MRGKKVAWLVGLVLIVGACGGNNPAEQFLESQDGIDNVDIDDDGGSFTVTDDEGNTLSVSGDEESLTITGDDGETLGEFGSGDIPGDFPIPTLPGANVQAVVVTPPATLVILDYSAADYSYEEIVAVYDEFSTASGISVIGKMVNETAPAFASWSLQMGTATYDITVHDETDGILLVQLSANLSG